MFIYINPFNLDNKLDISSTKKNDKYKSVDELIELLKYVYYTKACFGKFDVYNKWNLHKIDKKMKDINKLNDNLKRIFLKPTNICYKCKHFTNCAEIRIDLKALSEFWDEILMTNGEYFKSNGTITKITRR